MTMQKTTTSILQWALIAAFSLPLPAQSLNKPPLVQSAAQAMKNVSTVLKYNPNTTDKIDTYVYDSLDTIDKTIQKIEKDIPAEKRKAVEKAIKQEVKDAEKTFKHLFKKHVEKLDKKILTIVSEDEINKVDKTIKDATTELDTNAKKTFDQPDVKALGKEIEQACEPIKQTLDNIDGSASNID